MFPFTAQPIPFGEFVKTSAQADSLEAKILRNAQVVYNVSARLGIRSRRYGLMTQPNPKPRRVTVIASGLLCGALALVVIYTRRSAFFSPLAIVIIAAIGAAAVLLQLWLRNREHPEVVRPPTWLNALGIVLAIVALFSERLGLNAQVTQLVALGAVGSFAVSSAIILHAFRKDKNRTAGISQR